MSRSRFEGSQRWEDVDDFIDDAFPSGSRRIRDELDGAVAVLVPVVMLVKKGTPLSMTAWNQLCSGHFVSLGPKTTRKELRERFLLEADMDQAEAFDDELIERLRLAAPG